MGKISKIWSQNERVWYKEYRYINPYREFQYDKQIQWHLEILFPEFIPIHYSRIIRQEGLEKGSRPDFALIRNDYKEWWIVEIERTEDNLDHVCEQIENFTDGEYTAYDEAKYMCKQNATLDFNKLLNMIQYVDVKVMLLVDELTENWRNRLSPYNPAFVVLKEFRNSGGDFVFSLDGDYPYIFDNESHCYVDDALNRMLKVVEPDVLQPEMDLPSDGRLISKLRHSANSRLIKWRIKKPENRVDVCYIQYRKRISEWQILKIKKSTFIKPFDPEITLKANDEYVLKLSSKKELILVETK